MLGVMSPFLMPSSIILKEVRSLILPPGLAISNLPYTSIPVKAESCLRCTRGVFPTVCKIESNWVGLDFTGEVRVAFIIVIRVYK